MTTLSFGEMRAIVKQARASWAYNCDGSERDVARYRVVIEQLRRQLLAAEAENAALKARITELDYQTS